MDRPRNLDSASIIMPSDAYRWFITKNGEKLLQRAYVNETNGETTWNEIETVFEEKYLMTDLNKIGRICAECANKLGGTWPDGHVATFAFTICDCCGERKSTCDVGDWNWPDRKRRGMRD